MKKFLYVLLLFMLNSCYKGSEIDSKDFHEFMIVHKVSVVNDTTDTIEQFKDLTIYKKYTLYSYYQIQYKFDADKLIGVDTFYKYYLFDTTKTLGILNDSISKKNSNTINKDSFESKLPHNIYANIKGYKEVLVKKEKGVTKVVYSSNQDTAIYEFDQSIERRVFSLDKKKETEFAATLLRYKYLHNQPKMKVNEKTGKSPVLQVDVYYEPILQSKHRMKLIELISKLEIKE